uniref:Uncharacterized protein n=1 Tax=Tanacetum cinerariifolium TaxID=118510 RepID=A0A699IIE2_TANCI|nr:hypothetical protein [Tanacetum cinerariifolium]
MPENKFPLRAQDKSNNDEIYDSNKSNKEHDEKEEEYDDEFNVEEGEKMDEEEDDEVTKELYKDVNVNIGNKYADITDRSNTNPSPTNTTITSLMDTTIYHEITSATTIPLPPHFFNHLQQEATPIPTSKTSEATTSFTSLSDFASIFKFNERVINMEKDMSEIKQVDQYAQALSTIPAIVNRYMDNKLGEVINKAIQAHNFDYVATSVIEKNVTKSLEVVVLTRSLSQPRSSYEAAATLSEFELIKILIDKMEKNKSFDVADYTRELYDAVTPSISSDI